MKPQLLLFPFICLVYLSTAAQQKEGDPKLTEIWRPEPKVVAPGKTAADAPADAIVLFDGGNLSSWENSSHKGEVTWKAESNILTVTAGNGNIQTKKGFADCQLHIEWRTPSAVKGDGQGRGNSGIFLMCLYELQVLDSYNNRTYSNGQAGSIYKQLIPLANPTRPPGEWQTYDVVFTAPRFKADSSLQSPARITVLLNGVLVQNNAVLWGPTENIGIPAYKMHGDKEPLMLQDHGNPTSFRNIWIREL
ncbi:MAG: DUF1080 domain-containing protein [Bacteroidota bacterium]|nr:DUF1080 domain-containing protein [Bacteroidota bacterium]